jgi:hypothetical protein
MDAQVVFVEMPQRYIITFFSDSAGEMLPCLDTNVYDAKRAFVAKIDEYSVVLWPPFTDYLNWMLSRQPWPPPILLAKLDVPVSGVEDGLANTILTLPFATQQEILLAMICCSGIGDRKAKLQAQFTQMRPGVRVAQDAQDLLVECYVWFINLLSSESNEVHNYKQLLLNYILLDIIDVEAHYIVVSAYQYMSLTSVMLQDCWSVPCVIVCSWIFLKASMG